MINLNICHIKPPLPIVKSDSTDTTVFYARASAHFTVLYDRGVGGPPCVCRVGWPVFQDPSCPPGPQLLQAPSSSFAFSSLQRLEPLQIYLLSGLSGQLNTPRQHKGCASLCEREITEMIVLLQKSHCFVKEKLGKSRFWDLQYIWPAPLFDAGRSQGWYTVYSIPCFLCLSCEYLQQGLYLILWTNSSSGPEGCQSISLSLHIFACLRSRLWKLCGTAHWVQLLNRIHEMGESIVNSSVLLLFIW